MVNWDVSCVYCGKRGWAREVGEKQNLVEARQVVLPGGRHCHARCMGHYFMDVGIKQVLGTSSSRQLEIARVRFGLPASKEELDFPAVSRVAKVVGGHPPEVSEFNQLALRSLSSLSVDSTRAAEVAEQRRTLLERVRELVEQAGETLDDVPV